MDLAKTMNAIVTQGLEGLTAPSFSAPMTVRTKEHVTMEHVSVSAAIVASTVPS